MMINMPELFFKGVPTRPYRDPDEHVMELEDFPVDVRTRLSQQMNHSHKVSPGIYLTLRPQLFPGDDGDGDVYVTHEPLHLPEVWNHMDDFRAPGYDSGNEDELAAARPGINWDTNRGNFYTTREFERRESSRVHRRRRRAENNTAFARYYARGDMLADPDDQGYRSRYEHPYTGFQPFFE